MLDPRLEALAGKGSFSQDLERQLKLERQIENLGFRVQALIALIGGALLVAILMSTLPIVSSILAPPAECEALP